MCFGQRERVWEIVSEPRGLEEDVSKSRSGILCCFCHHTIFLRICEFEVRVQTHHNKTVARMLFSSTKRLPMFSRVPCKIWCVLLLE
jgi:hypothetical protein